MYSAFYWIPPLLAGLVCCYISIPILLRGLKAQAPFEHSVLGDPDTDDLFARRMSGMQLRFLWFVLSGEAYSVTSGGTRASAVFAWLGYVVTGISFLGYLIQGH